MAKSETGATGLIRGKIGGYVYFVVNGQQRIRELTPVTNPQTARQTEVRSINTELSRTWRDDLNQGQRTAWNQRAEQEGTKGELLFIKQNFQLLDFGLAKVITPPPRVMPPELTDLVLLPTTDKLEIEVPQLVDGIITAQTPFIDIEIAGGFTEARLSVNDDYTAEIDSEALSQGRVHQNSDFRHALYVADIAIIEPPAEVSTITVEIPNLSTRNVVLRIRRYNKFGNFSEVLVFQGIRTRAV